MPAVLFGPENIAECGWSASEVLAGLVAHEVGHLGPISAFLVSWHDIRGRSQTGYFLGREAVKELAHALSLKEIALLEAVEGRLRPALERLATGDPGRWTGHAPEGPLE
jgi:hypothetical protein